MISLSLIVSMIVFTMGVTRALSQVIGPNVSISGLAGADDKVENMPALATLGEKMVAAWHYDGSSGGTYARLAVSIDGGATWADSVLQQNPGEAIFGRAAVAIDATSTAFCALLGALAFDGWTIFVYKRSLQDVTANWIRLPNAAGIMRFGEEQPDGIKLLCDRSSNVLYLVFTRKPQRYEGRIQFLRSTDGGASWSAPIEISGSRCNTAQLALGPDGELYVVWEDYAQRAIVGRKSMDHGITFEPPFTVGAINDNVLRPPGWSYSIFRQSLVPNAGGMDFPALLGLAVDGSAGPRRGALYAVWAEHGRGTADPEPRNVMGESEPNHWLGNATPVEIGDDFGGFMLSADLPPYLGDSDNFTFMGTAGTTIQITGAATYCHPFAGCRESSHSFTLWCGDDTTNVTRIGEGTLYGLEPIPPVVYTLPTTGRYYLLAGGSSASSVSYHISLREYVVAPGEAARDHRDIVMVGSTDGGLTWSDKVRVNDDPPLHDESFPAVEVDGSGLVHVAWYGRRDEPECGARVNTYWTWSGDGGRTFAPSRRMSDQPSDAGGVEYALWQVGDHMELHTEGDKVHLLWTYIPLGTRDGEIYGATITDMPTAITIGRFDAELQGSRVIARWSVGDERGVSGYRVHRAKGHGEFATVAFVAVSGRREYRWEDAGVQVGHRYRYRLEVVRPGGPSTWEGPIEVSLVRAPVALRWRDAVPNPFDEVIVLGLDGMGTEAARIQVLDITGHRVATLRPEVDGAGILARWNGTDDSGRPVAPGIYLVRAESAGRHAVRRVIRMR